MATKRTRKPLWILALPGLAALALALWIVLSQPGGTPLSYAVQVFALLGYFTVFLSILSSAFLRELTRRFGRPFVQVHHAVAITGLVLISLHPVVYAWLSRSLSVFVPTFASWFDFWLAGGRPALWLILLAALTAALRKPLGNRWRAIHVVTYLAFLFATVHANLIGGHMQNVFARIITIAMLVIATGVLVYRRLPRKRPAKPARA
jgi:sulfoxide reductase heme-binding subunit YedZ